MIFTLDLNWKNFNVDLETVSNWIKQNITSVTYTGSSANSCFQLHFLNQPTQDEIDLIEMYWTDIAPDSEEAQKYKSISDRKTELETKKQTLLASATVKFKAFGLSDEEIAAWLGKV